MAMDKNKAAKNVDEYIAQFPPDVKASLESLRKTIKAAAPKAEELISYMMPAYKLNGMLVYFAGYKNHIGFYGTSAGHETFAKELSGYKSGKGSVQFPLDKPLPLKLITQIVKFRVAQNNEKAVAKKPVKVATKKTKPVKLSDKELVEEWINKLQPAAKKEIETVRKIIKTASPKLSERIKWNAPSYYYKEDILTFGPYKTHKLLLIFHHPAVVKVKSNLLEGEYKDRRLVHFKDKADAEKNKTELLRIINEIIKMIDKK
jgi:uncharacterized protein YdhG (YjbR/CyaY superfamily)